MGQILDFTKHQQARCLETQRQNRTKTHRLCLDRLTVAESYWLTLCALTTEMPTESKPPAESCSTTNHLYVVKNLSPKK